MRRFVAQMAVLVLGLSVPFLVAPQASAAPEGRVIHVAASGGSDAGDGSAAKPYQTISTAISAASTGDIIELADGTYREGELSVDKGVTIRAAQGATPVISGAQVPRTWNNAGNGTWSTDHDMVRFCTVCTTNADPEVEGMAAHPEQVFVDGKPLTQVGSRAEVTASTFYVDDPDPVTLKEAGNNRAGYNVKPHTGASYVIGVDPAQHHVEVVQHHRALSSAADNVTLSGLVVEKYSAVQRWDYADPEIGTHTGGGMVVASGGNLRIEGSTFRYSSSATAVQIIDATTAVVTGNLFEDNGSNGFGINNSTGVTVERNLWTSNNTADHITTGCGAYCTLADTKITHADGVRFAFNTVDYSEAGYDISEPAVYADHRGAGVWFDEGVINSEIVGNYFVNTPVAMFNEVSSNNLIASNIVEGAGVGIHVSGSDNTRIWNNTISHALTSVMIQEDTRSDGCNARRADGSCARLQPWSAEHGLSWDTTGTVISNNIFSSEQTQAKEGDPWRFSAMLQVTGGANDDGSGAVYANDMISSIDHNVYYRAQDNGNPSTTVLWNWGKDLSTQSINAPALSEFTASPHVTVSGKEANGLDQRGSRAENPFFVNESANPTAWKTSDFHLKPGSQASGTGQALPADVAGELGVSAGTAVDRGALVNVAWEGGSAQAGAGAPAPAQAQPAADQGPASGADQAGTADSPQVPAAAPAGEDLPAQAPADQAGAPQAPAGQAPAAQAPADQTGAGSGGASGSAQAVAGQTGADQGASGGSTAGSASASGGAARSGSATGGHAAAGVTIASDSVPGGVDDRSPVGAVAAEAQPANGASSAEGGSLARAGLVAPGLIILSVAAVVLGAGALASRRRMSGGR